MTREIWFDSWSGLARVVIVAVVAYVALIIVLRVSGKRVLSKMNAFDLIVTVAIGSTFATILLSKQVALAEGVVALAMLASLQVTVAWLSVRSSAISQLVKSEPTLLYRDGYLPAQLRAARVVEAEIRAAVRGSGISSMDEVAFVVLETDGSFTVMSKSSQLPSALEGIEDADVH